MCRKLLLAATILSLAAAPALAAEAPKSRPAAVKKATAAERAVAERADPVARAAFWARELEIDPTDQDAGVRMSAALRQLGQYDKAAETAQIVATNNPANVEAWLEIARAKVGGGHGFFAIEPARKAQALKPKDWRAPSLLGIGLEQSERYEEAEAAYRQALALSPDNPSVLANLAMMKAGQGDGDQAETLLRRAVAQPGATIQIRQDLSLILGLRGKLAEAEKLMRQDLPPEVANNNLAYLKALANGETARPPAGVRSYQSLQRSQDGG
ncbi:MAG TPA: tetratricopeptide repeat protein [Caulobacteraceae bacterium]|nr:tetratricopeptide repeat protein [Caulobacteraceae bacterium]